MSNIIKKIIIVKIIKKMIIFTIILIAMFFAFSAILEAQAPEPRQYPVKEYAQYVVEQQWGLSQWRYFDELVMRESGWNPQAQNPHSTAFGIAQFLNSTWATVGFEKTNDPHTQIDAMIVYVEQRYGTPQEAIQFHNQHNWY